MYQQSTNRENKSNMIGQTRFFLIKVNLLTMKKAEVRHGNSYFFFNFLCLLSIYFKVKKTIYYPQLYH